MKLGQQLEIQKIMELIQKCSYLLFTYSIITGFAFSKKHNKADYFNEDYILKRKTSIIKLRIC